MLAGIAALACALSGCAVGLATDQEAAFAEPNLEPGDARIYFLRSSSIVGAAIEPEIRLNGEVIGISRPGGFFYVTRPAGSYYAATSMELKQPASFELSAGEIKYLRTLPTTGGPVGRIVVEVESADKARAELPSLSFTGTEKVSAR